MDRLKGNHHYVNDNSETYLQSSMDRLKVTDTQLALCEIYDLQSSMDRLKVRQLHK